MFSKKNKALYILVFLLFVQFQFFGQQRKEIYLLIDEPVFIQNNIDYHRLIYNIRSKDIRFKNDLYYFDVPPNGFELISLNDLGKEVSLNDIKYIKTSTFFKNKSACEAHEELNLNSIYLIKDISNEKDKPKYMMWEVIYSGTIKNRVYTNLR